MKYRKKPVVIEAIRFTGDNWADVERFAPGHVIEEFAGSPCEVYDNLHDTWVAFDKGDWIIKGVKGEFYPCVDTVFQETYEEES